MTGTRSLRRPDPAAGMAVAGLSGRQLQLQPRAGIGGRCRPRRGCARACSNGLLPSLASARAGTTRCCLPRRGGARQPDGDLGELADLGEALAGSRERHGETILQGAAFRVAAITAGRTKFSNSLPAGLPLPGRRGRCGRRERPAARGGARRLPARLCREPGASSDPAWRDRPQRCSVGRRCARRRCGRRRPAARQARHSTISARRRSSPKSCR